MTTSYATRTPQKQSIFKPLMLLGVMLMLLLSTALKTSAAEDIITIAFPANHAEGLNEAVSKMQHKEIVPKEGTSSGAPIFSVSGSTVTFNKGEFEQGTTRSQRDVLGSFVGEVEKSAVPSSTKRKVMDGVQSSSDNVNKLMIPLLMSESGADMYGAQQAIKGGVPAVKIVFGILAHIIIYGLVLSTLLDLTYMGLPFARSFGAGKDGGDQKPVWVTYDAYSAIRDAESGETYKNPYLKYFWRRSWTYVIAAVIITWLVVGELGNVISLFMALGDGFISSD